MDMKRIGFLSFGHWQPRSGSQTRTAADALLQTIELAQAAEEIGIDGAYAGEPDRIAAELAADEAVRAADTVLFMVPNQLGVAYNARILGTIAKHIAPAIGWTPANAVTAT